MIINSIYTKIGESNGIKTFQTKQVRILEMQGAINWRLWVDTVLTENRAFAMCEVTVLHGRNQVTVYSA